MQAKKPLNPTMSIKAPAFVPASLNQSESSSQTSEQASGPDAESLKRKLLESKKPLKKEKKQGSPLPD